MNCPVCDRSLAPTLSICPACGAMMNDTVREELQTKITAGVPARMNPKPQPPSPSLIKDTVLPRSYTVSPPIKRIETADLTAPKTSPTLVGFQNKNSALPDWRIQLQNAVKQRRGSQPAAAVAEAMPAPVRIEAKPTAIPQPEVSDPRVANALKRINESRTTFTESQPRMTPVKKAKPAQMRPFPFDVVAASAAPSLERTNAPGPSAAPVEARVQTPPKPKLVPPAPAPEKPDTNKLPPLVEALPERVRAVDQKDQLIIETPVSGPLPTEFAEIKRIRIKADDVTIHESEFTSYNDEIEDLAPFSMRFGAGLFDLITGTFLAGLVLMPFVLAGAEFVNSRGLLIYGGTWALTQFVYMTVCLGFLGKTLGMRLFSLELVDAVENEYPTLRQAAVNSCIYIIGLPLVGAGFLTVLFNEEHRALHDLMSGTIQVREF